MRDRERFGSAKRAEVGMKRTFALIAAVITCPCHYPIWIGLLAGTAVGAALTQYAVPVFAGGSLFFLLFVWLAIRDASRR